MAVDLKFYHYDVNTKQKTLITNGYNLGNLFKGSQKKFSFTIYNDGDTTAVSPFVSFKRYQSNSDKPIEWKSVSFMENSNYDKGLELPDIKPKSWLTGKDVYSEDFQGATLSASYYKPLITTNVDEGEIVGAREGKANLRDNMIRKINYKPFTADRL